MYFVPRPLAECGAVHPLSWWHWILSNSAKLTLLLVVIIYTQGKKSEEEKEREESNTLHT